MAIHSARIVSLNTAKAYRVKMPEISWRCQWLPTSRTTSRSCLLSANSAIVSAHPASRKKCSQQRPRYTSRDHLTLPLAVFTSRSFGRGRHGIRAAPTGLVFEVNPRVVITGFGVWSYKNSSTSVVHDQTVWRIVTNLNLEFALSFFLIREQQKQRQGAASFVSLPLHA
ncbi:hypothetical protein GGH92_006930, partial [Coemansia sp. RSA 2673]